MNMQNTKDELRMPADDFDRIMRRALQTPAPPRTSAKAMTKSKIVKKAKKNG
jgi:hypothetical protein